MENGKLKFLIAENDFNAALGIKLKVEELGWEVTSMVSSAIEAITKTELDKPNVILMDVLLNGSLDGVEAVKIISYKNIIPVIFMVNDDSQNLLSKKKPDIHYEVIIKPVTKTSLEEAIGRIRKSINYNEIFPNVPKQRPYTF